MKKEALLFGAGPLFFVPVSIVYCILTDFEPVGTLAILLVGGLTGMIGGYFWVVSRRIDRRPEDDPEGEIAEAAGEVGTFAPYSWWPLVTALGAAFAFTALAIGYWLMIPGTIIGVIGLVGWIFEFSRGQHAH